MKGYEAASLADWWSVGVGLSEARDFDRPLVGEHSSPCSKGPAAG